MRVVCDSLRPLSRIERDTFTAYICKYQLSMRFVQERFPSYFWAKRLHKYNERLMEMYLSVCIALFARNGGSVSIV